MHTPCILAIPDDLHLQSPALGQAPHHRGAVAVRVRSARDAPEVESAERHELVRRHHDGAVLLRLVVWFVVD